MKEKTKIGKLKLAFSIALFSLIVIGATFAYLAANVEGGAEARVRVITSAADSLMLEAGKDLYIDADTVNFGQGSGNVFDSTTVTATLKSSSNDEEIIYYYNIYLDISKNELTYTTPEKTAEVLLKIVDPEGNEITSLPTLNYVTVDGESGFDITTASNSIPIAIGYEIKTNNTTIQEWTITVTLINLDTKQTANMGKEFDAKILIQREEVDAIIASQVEETLNSMSLEEKIAQMTIISFDGTSINTSLSNELALKPGGVILFAGNITNYANTLNFINNIKATASIPMFVSVDQEGGRVQRIKSSTDSRVLTIPAMREVGYKNDSQLAYDLGKVIAEEILAFGFNMDFAPTIDVVDVTSTNVIGNRSFGGDPNLVSRLGTSLYNGILDTGVIPSYKHFPGHGATDKDTHEELPVLSQTKEELMQRDLIPFQYAIDHGAELIMVGHLSIPNIDPEGYPASLSSSLINGLLKEEMGFKGLVITDSLQMGAIADNYTEKLRYELAINAGVDILLMPQSCQSAVSNIKQSVNEGKITEERINESVKKILTLKYTKLRTEALPESYLGSADHQAVLDRISN